MSDEHSDNVPMNCPRCDLALMEYPNRVKGVSGCPGCSGLWLTESVVLRKLGESAQKRLSSAAGSPTGRLRCPEDGNALSEVKLSKVTVDTCSHCLGLWLDAGEWERILAGRLKGVSLDRGGKADEPVWIQVLDGATYHLPELLELIVSAIIDNLLDGV